MKIHLKDNKIALYDIESDYRQYLFQYDFRVNLKEKRGNITYGSKRVAI